MRRWRVSEVLGKPIVVFADIPLRGDLLGHLSKLSDRAELVSPHCCSSAEIARFRSDATVWITRSQPIGEADLETMPRLKLLSAWGVGYDHIDVKAATVRGIPVCINPVFTRSVAEAALTLIFALAKRLPALMGDARAGRHTPDEERGVEIRDKTLGIIGLGRIGREIGILGQCLEMQVIAFDPLLRPEQFPTWCESVTVDDLLSRSDFVVIAAPLTPETHHMIGAKELALMKPTAFLINIARGPLVDENALIAALKEGHIAGAGLDVWEQEPLQANHPLLAMDNVIGTPHRLSATRESLQQIGKALQENILLVLTDQRPRNVINPDVFGDTE